jgi:OmpA-OmpF porin, OOP family
MKRGSIITLLAIGMGWAYWPVQSAAQNRQDLTDHNPTPEEIGEALKPHGAPPTTKGTRGIGPVTTATKPRCEHYWQQAKRSRGIKLTQDMNSVALKVTFATNSAQLTPEAGQTLDNLGKALQSDDLATCCFQIEGHTDSVGSDAYNLRLSQRRAQSVAQYLAEHYNLKERALAVGYGKRQPIADNDTPEGRQKNRRVQIVNLGYGKLE